MPNKLLALFSVFLLLVVVSFGIFFYYSYPLLRTNDIPGGPVVSVTKTVKGKVVSVNGSSMTVEYQNKKLTILSAQPVNIFGLTPASNPQETNSPETENKDATNASQPSPFGLGRPSKEVLDANAKKMEFADFSSIPVGTNVQAVLVLQKNGIFLTQSVNAGSPE